MHSYIIFTCFQKLLEEAFSSQIIHIFRTIDKFMIELCQKWKDFCYYNFKDLVTKCKREIILFLRKIIMENSIDFNFYSRIYQLRMSIFQFYDIVSC